MTLITFILYILGAAMLYCSAEQTYQGSLGELILTSLVWPLVALGAIIIRLA